MAQQNAQNATRIAQQGSQAASEVIQSTVQAGNQAAQQTTKAANQAAQQNAETGRQTGQENVEATKQTVEQGTEAASQTAEQGAKQQDTQEGTPAAQRATTGVPIKDYDNSNVGTIVEQLDKLSAEELQATRTYEQHNKNRDGLLQQIDRRINAASQNRLL